jgi:1,2-diacylglycerol-3-alpha-glucose alpha-1,2-galactosyltransferase
MSILEAVNSRKPVLLRNLELYEDILFVDKDTYAKAPDVDGFCEQNNKLATDKKYYEHYQEGSKYISDFYSKEHVKNLWREYYQRIYNKWAPLKKLKTRKKKK